MEKEIMSKRELSEYLRLSRATIDNLMKKDLPYFKVGGRVLFRKSAIDKWLETKAVPRKK